MEVKIPDQWTNKSYHTFINDLIKLGDEKYRKFNSKIIFTEYKMIGIKMPLLKKISKEIYHSDFVSFLKVAKDDYYEIVLIEGIIISMIKDLDQFLFFFEPFILKIDNWAICDTCISKSMKVVPKNKEFFFDKSKEYLQSDHEYVVRIGILLIMTFYINEDHIDEVFLLLNSIQREEYYINMAIAWLISYAFIKYKDKTLEYLKSNQLNKFTQNKAISKIRDSFRVSKEDKEWILQYKK